MMSKVESVRDSIVRAFRNRAGVVKGIDGSLEVVVRGGLSANELLFLRTLLSDAGYDLSRIYFHRKRDALVVRFKRISHGGV